jgi:hypothetical protein
LTKIDETTGLAQVPDDMFWRVTETKLDLGTSYKDVGAVTIHLFRTTTTTEPEFENYSYVDNSFWKRVITGEKKTKVTEIIPAKTKTGSMSVVHSPLLKVEKKKPADLEGWTEYWYSGYWAESAETRWYKVMPHTAEQLRDESIRCWKHYIKAQHTLALEEDRSRELAKVLGDYPPKSLKDLVDA